MRYDVIGGILFAVSAFLYASRYLAAALFMGPGLSNWNGTLFKAAYGYIGDGLTTWATITLIAGLGCIAVGVMKDLRQGKEGA